MASRKRKKIETVGDVCDAIGELIDMKGDDVLALLNEARAMGPMRGEDFLHRKLKSKAFRKMIGLRSVKAGDGGER